jgi:drug/metabolite transporter (DMT)-like permease
VPKLCPKCLVTPAPGPHGPADVPATVIRMQMTNRGLWFIASLFLLIGGALILFSTSVILGILLLVLCGFCYAMGTRTAAVPRRRRR